MKSFYPTIVLLFVFLIDLVTGLWIKIQGMPDPETWDEFLQHVTVYNTAKSWFDWTPYLLIMYFAIVRPKLDKWDEGIAFTGLLSCILTTMDWYFNNNWRPVEYDLFAFPTIMLILVTIKIINHIKTNNLMKGVKFGLSQIRKQSPLFISRLKRALNFFTSAVAVCTPFVCRVTGINELDFIQGLGLAGILINTIGIMFGVDPEEQEEE